MKGGRGPGSWCSSACTGSDFLELWADCGSGLVLPFLSFFVLFFSFFSLFSLFFPRCFLFFPHFLPLFFVLFCPFWDFPDFSFPICPGTLQGFSRFVLFLFLGLLTAPMRNSPERVRDTIWTFPEKSGKPPVWKPGLASLNFRHNADTEFDGEFIKFIL